MESNCDSSTIHFVSCLAPVNIAVIKYWGKRDEKLILPLNDSISLTLSTNEMHARTTVITGQNFKEDKMWLNNTEDDLNKNSRLRTCLEQVRRNMAHDEPKKDWKIHIRSENNFPTAAGLASSAAGYACLVYSLSKLFKVDVDVSCLARQGSGSACRSVLGGFVQWEMGNLPDGSDSIAKMIQPASHWPEMKALILVANSDRKKVPSSIGMARSVEMSSLLKHRAENCVPNRVHEMKRAINNRDYDEFARLTMMDSNQLHAVCLDTFPPCVYMSETSHAVVDLLHKINEHFHNIVVCYTFDAGPNACLFLLEEYVPLVAKLVEYFFPPAKNEEVNEGKDYFRGGLIKTDCDKHIEQSFEKLKRSITVQVQKQKPGAIRYVIHTSIGDGPKVIEQGTKHHESEC